MNYKNKVYDTVTAYMKNLDELDGLEKELATQERAETISRIHAAERREEWEQQRKAAYENTLQEIEHIRRSHSEAVDEWNRLDGSKLDKDAEILKLDVPMTQVQYQQLCDKHRDNSLMLSLLCDYADRHQSEALYADRPSDARQRKADFDDLCVRAANTCRNPQSLSAAFFLDGKSVPESCSYEY